MWQFPFALVEKNNYVTYIVTIMTTRTLTPPKPIVRYFQNTKIKQFKLFSKIQFFSHYPNAKKTSFAIHIRHSISEYVTSVCKHTFLWSLSKVQPPNATGLAVEAAVCKEKQNIYLNSCSKNCNVKVGICLTIILTLYNLFVAVFQNSKKLLINAYAGKFLALPKKNKNISVPGQTI